jgi:hypothetical protein
MNDRVEKVEPRNVSMYPLDWATVEAYAKDMGYPSTSAALRRIVDEWKRLKGKEVGVGREVMPAGS